MPIIGTFSPGSIIESREIDNIQELLNQLPDNSQNLIDPSDIRDSIYTLWEKTESISASSDQVRSITATSSDGVNYTALSTTTITSYVDDMIFLTTFLTTNMSSIVSIDIDSLGQVDVFKTSTSGLTPLNPGDLKSDIVYTLLYDGDDFQLTIPNDWTGGTNYILVKAEGTDIENATELQAAYDLATSMSPTSINRITIVAAPGNYNFGNSFFILNTSFINLVSLDGNRSIILNSIQPNGTISTAPNLNNVIIKGVDTLNKTFRLLTGLSGVVIENCKGGDDSFRPAGGVYSSDSTFINCEGGNGSFLTATNHTANGVYINCIGGVGSWGSGTLSGTFSNCIGGVGSFGSGSGSTVSGTFTNCVGGDSSFGGSLTGVGGSLSGEFKDCQGGDHSFGSGGIITSNTIFNNCQGGDYSFGSFGTASGTFTNCIGGVESFGGDGGTLSGRVIRCQLTSGTFQTPTGSGIIILGIDGNDSIINLTA